MNKDLTIILTGRFLQIIIMLFSIRIITYFFTPEELGNYYIALAILVFINIVFLNPSSMYFTRHILLWQKSNNLANALFVSFLVTLIISLITIPIIIFMYKIFDYSDKFNLIAFILFFTFSIIISTLHRRVLYGINIMGFRIIFVKFLILTQLMGLVLSSSLSYFYYPSTFNWLYGILVSEVIAVYFILKVYLQSNSFSMKIIKKTITIKRLKLILIFILPIAITNISMWGLNLSYRFIIDYKYSAEVLGYIAVGLGVSKAVFSSIETVSMQYWNPIFLKKILDSNKPARAEAWNNIAKQIVPIYILAAFFTIAMSEVLINILVDDKFHDSYIYTIFGVVIEFFTVMTNLLKNVSQSEYDTTTTIKPYLFGFIVSFVLLCSIDFGINYFMIPLILAVSYILVFIYMYVNMKKLLDIKYDFNIFKIVFVSLPFFLINFLDLSKLNISLNIFVIFIFGLYFLLIIWLWHKKSMKKY